MKKLVILILASCLSLLAANTFGKTEVAIEATETNTVRIFCNPELEPLSSAWSSEFVNNNNDIKMTTVVVDDPLSQLITEKEFDFAILTQCTASNMEEFPLKVLVGKKVLVPVISKKNEFLAILNQTGVTPQTLADLLSSSQEISWGILLNNSNNKPLPFFTTSTARKTSTFQRLILNDETTTTIGLLEGQSIEEFMDKNPNTILFSSLPEIIDEETNSFINGIQVLPFDRNANQHLDYMENIYSSLDDFSRAVWIGKYPKLFSESLYLVSNEIPNQDMKYAFVEWVLTQGQELLNVQGYAALTGAETKAGLAMLYANDEFETTTSTASGRSVWPFILAVLVIIFALGVVINFVFIRKASSITSVASSQSEYTTGIHANSINIPKGVWFDNTHTWLFREKNGDIRLGLDDFFQHLTGSLTRIELKRTGENVVKGEALLTIARDGKRLTIYSPISGTITDSNLSLLDNPSTLNAAPYSEGWIYLVEPLNWKHEMKFLKLAENYHDWIKVELVRLKDIFSTILKPMHLENKLVLQDGGVVKDGILAEMEPQVWEEFQINFINSTK